MKKRIIIGLLALAVVLTIAVAANATTATKQIEATYRNIIIMANGNVVAAEPGMGEPFIVTSEGRTYVPIKMAAQALGATVEWVDWLNAVKITGSASSSELEALKAENAALKDKITRLEEGSGSLSDLESNLIDDYDTLGDVEIDDLTLDGDEDDVDVTIEVDLADYDSEWADLSDSDIENFIEGIVSDIQDEYSEDTVVSGVITDIDSGDDLVDFTKDGTDDLAVDFNDGDYRDGGSSSDADHVVADLEDSSYSVGVIDFTMSISCDGSNDSATADLTADTSDAATDWDDMSTRDIEDDVTNICEDIATAFDDAGVSLDTIDISFYDEHDNRLDRYDYDVSSGVLN